MVCISDHGLSVEMYSDMTQAAPTAVFDDNDDAYDFTSLDDGLTGVSTPDQEESQSLAVKVTKKKPTKVTKSASDLGSNTVVKSKGKKASQVEPLASPQTPEAVVTDLDGTDSGMIAQ